MSKSNKTFQKYDLHWDQETSAIEIEIWLIQQGEDWIKERGRTLFFHYRELQNLLWPNYDSHEWSDLMLKTILENRITTVIGPKDAGKTHGMAKYALTDYFCFPRET